ncbi:hypothetical protein B0T16DRAFT_392809 [Cercophora newfieldiana]|uniref:Uncharacterized protein n=1 Tax=Cercophora newfieldiana TaxID=92897 RepID=A0AA39Y210_9PEZI|nr:hypothetical protein B0T16DRAFT_392809 [Cercophora newfieldiana]
MAPSQDPNGAGDMTGENDVSPSPDNDDAHQPADPQETQIQALEAPTKESNPLAVYQKHGIYFDVRLSAMQSTWYQGERAHILHLTLNCVRPLKMTHRIVGAKVEVSLYPISNLQGVAPCTPYIQRIRPQVNLVQISDREIETHGGFSTGVSGSGGPVNISFNRERSKSERAVFKGVRLIHGVLLTKQSARWKLYEDAGSCTGIPQLVKFVMVVRCESSFGISVSASVQARLLLTLGITRSFKAMTYPGNVPSLKEVEEHAHLSDEQRVKAVTEMFQDLKAASERRHRAFDQHLPPETLLAAVREISAFNDSFPYWRQGLSAGDNGKLSEMIAWAADEEERNAYEMTKPQRDAEAAEETQRGHAERLKRDELFNLSMDLKIEKARRMLENLRSGRNNTEGVGQEPSGELSPARTPSPESFESAPIRRLGHRRGRRFEWEDDSTIDHDDDLRRRYRGNARTFKFREPAAEFTVRPALKDEDLDDFSPVGPGYNVLSLD